MNHILLWLQSEILGYLEKACQLIPDEGLTAECKEMVDNYYPILMGIITGELVSNVAPSNEQGNGFKLGFKGIGRKGHLRHPLSELFSYDQFSSVTFFSNRIVQCFKIKWPLSLSLSEYSDE